MEAIETRVQDTVAYFKEQVAEIPGARVQTPEGFSAGAVNVAIEGADPAGQRRLLWERPRIVITSPAGGLRFSIAFFTTREEVHRAVEVKDARSFATGIGLLADLYDLMSEDHWLEGGLKLAGAMVDVYMDGD